MENSCEHSIQVSAYALRPLFIGLQARGYDPSSLLNPEEQPLLNSDSNYSQRLSLYRFREIWQSAITLTANPALGIELGLQMDTASLGVIGHVLANAPNVGKALLLWNHFSQLLLDQPLFELQVQGQQASLSTHAIGIGDAEFARPAAEFATFSLLRLAVFLTSIEPENDQSLMHVEFRHQQPSNPILERYQEALLGNSVYFGKPTCRIVFSARFLQQPLPFADSDLLELTQHHANEMLKALAVEEDIVVRARAAIRRRLVGASPSANAIAGDCNMSRATLQRRLQAASYTFQALLDEERMAIASQWLQRRKLSLEELSFVLGYSEPSAFHHAFKRWTGTTPIAYREAALRQQPASINT